MRMPKLNSSADMQLCHSFWRTYLSIMLFLFQAAFILHSGLQMIILKASFVPHETEANGRLRLSLLQCFAFLAVSNCNTCFAK